MGTAFGHCCICDKKLGMDKNIIKGARINGKLCGTCCLEANVLIKFLKEDIKITTDLPCSFEREKQAISYLSPIEIDNENKESISNLIVQTEQKMNRIKTIKEQMIKDPQKFVSEPELDPIVITTGYSFEGYKITKYFGVISHEVVLGTGFFSELNAIVADSFGTTSSGYSGKLSKAKRMALDKVKQSAFNIGANALIGVDFDINTIGNNMVIASVDATAVLIEPEDKNDTLQELCALLKKKFEDSQYN